MTLNTDTQPAVDWQRNARAHMMLHFTDMERLQHEDVPVLVRGEGCYVFTEDGTRKIDGLAGLYCTNIGHGFGRELGEAALAQMSELGYTTNWTTAHPRAIELSTKLAELAPGGLNRSFFVNSGSEAVESAWKIARQYHAARGEGGRRKAISRRYAYHGTTLGALSFTGITSCRTPFEPLAVPTAFVSNTNRFRHPLGHDDAAFCRALLDEVVDTIEFEGPETIAMLIAEPVQNAGGSLVPPDGYWSGLREICDRYGILLCSDEVICAWGRLGAWFGAEKFGYEPDLLTFAKGITSAHVPLGGVLIHDRVAGPFLDGRAFYSHGATFGGHPVAAAVALKNLEIMEREDVLGNVGAQEGYLSERLQDLRELPIVGDVRGMGLFWALELVSDEETNATFTPEEEKWLLHDFLSGRLYDRGLLCRLDDREDAVVQIAPPLVADEDVLGEIVDILQATLQEAGEELRARR
ncbi:MAG TPA: aspartate aminotransferase family protein [Solirubrobacteraceae bacterium]|jgi:adenosylmethionine-8-amino-7-oxononanoate aminotransferase